MKLDDAARSWSVKTGAVIEFDRSRERGLNTKGNYIIEPMDN